MSAKVIGFDKVMQGVLGAVKRYKDTSFQGLYAAGLEVERKAKKGAPILTGNLRGSGYTRRDLSFAQLRVLVGFYAYYAMFVHKKGPRPGGAGRKEFLYKAMQETDVRAIVKRYQRWK